MPKGPVYEDEPRYSVATGYPVYTPDDVPANCRLTCSPSNWGVERYNYPPLVDQAVKLIYALDNCTGTCTDTEETTVYLYPDPDWWGEPFTCSWQWVDSGGDIYLRYNCAYNEPDCTTSNWDLSINLAGTLTECWRGYKDAPANDRLYNEGYIDRISGECTLPASIQVVWV